MLVWRYGGRVAKGRQCWGMVLTNRGAFPRLGGFVRLPQPRGLAEISRGQRPPGNQPPSCARPGRARERGVEFGVAGLQFEVEEFDDIIREFQGD